MQTSNQQLNNLGIQKGIVFKQEIEHFDPIFKIAKSVGRCSLFTIFSLNFNFLLPKRAKLAYSFQLTHNNKNEQEGKTADFPAVEDWGCSWYVMSSRSLTQAEEGPGLHNSRLHTMQRWGLWLSVQHGMKCHFKICHTSFLSWHNHKYRTNHRAAFCKANFHCKPILRQLWAKLRFFILTFSCMATIFW